MPIHSNLVDMWGVDTWASRYARIGLADRLKGAGITDPELLYEPFETHNNWNLYTAGAGGIIRGNVGVGARGGILDLVADASETALAASVIRWNPIGSSPIYSIGQVGDIRGEPWYFALKFRHSDINVVSREQYYGLANVSTSHMAWIGASGSVSALKFNMQLAGSTVPAVLSSVSLDTAWHVVEMWGRGDGTLYGSFDGEPPISLAIPVGISGTWGLYCRNWCVGGAGAGAGTASLADALLIMGGAS